MTNVNDFDNIAGCDDAIEDSESAVLNGFDANTRYACHLRRVWGLPNMIDGRILRTLARQHWPARSLFLGPFHIRCWRAGNLTRHPQFAAMRAVDRTENDRVEDDLLEDKLAADDMSEDDLLDDDLADVASGYTAKPYVGRDT